MEKQLLFGGDIVDCWNSRYLDMMFVAVYMEIRKLSDVHT